MRLCKFILALFLTPVLSYADSSDDTLQQWLKKSDLVVVGTMGVDMVVVEEAGVPNYLCKFKVTDVCKGDASLKGQEIRINIMRFEKPNWGKKQPEANNKDQHPLLKTNSEALLFLKNTGTEKEPSWQSADFWFGVQHPFPTLIRSLKRLTAEEK